MSFKDGFRGTVNGAVQSTYADQPGVGSPGMLAFASDYHNTDAIFVGETNGVAAGLGIVLTAGNEGLGFQRPPELVFLPTSADNEPSDFGGIVVFDEAMQSDENGQPGWAKGRVARILRPSRAGGRIYVNAKAAITVGTSTVNWVIAGGSDNKYKAGEFSPTALAGNGTQGTSVALTNARWLTNAAAGGVAILELLGTAAEFATS